MSKMSRDETKFYLEVLRLFWSKLKIANSLGTTHLTVTRWSKGETLPSNKFRFAFQKALDDLFDQLEESGPIGNKIMGLIEDNIPETRDAVKIAPVSRRPLRSIILQALEGKTRVLSTKVLEAAAHHGYSQTQVYKVSRDLGIIKDKRGFGQNSYSYWKLP